MKEPKEKDVSPNHDKFYAAWLEIDQEFGEDPIYKHHINRLYDSYQRLREQYEELAATAQSYLAQLNGEWDGKE